MTGCFLRDTLFSCGRTYVVICDFGGLSLRFRVRTERRVGERLKGCSLREYSRRIEDLNGGKHT